MILQHFCKNFTEGCKVQVDDLKHDVPDEVVDIDMSKIRKFFSDDACIEIKRRGMVTHTFSL